MKIESDSIYQHEEFGEILVLGINQQYDTFETEEKTGIVDSVSVRYSTEWDGYGAMFGATRSEPLEQFVEAVGEQLR